MEEVKGLQATGFCWKRLGVTTKFVLVFSLLLLFVLLVALSGYFSLLSMRQAEAKIREYTLIREIVLNMDRGLEKARRLHQDFFLQYHQTGLQQAHEQYAQPSVREISRVISLSSKLQKLLFHSNHKSRIDISPVDVNLYLASAKRFADTSIAAVELITERAAPERGVESRLETAFSLLASMVDPGTRVWRLHNSAFGHYKDYLISRRRFQMQSALNELSIVHNEIIKPPLPAGIQRRHSLEHLQKITELANALLVIDSAITGKFRDFSLQEKIIAPVSAKMIQLSLEEVARAEQRVDRIFVVTGIVIPAISILAIFVVLQLARVMNISITRKILQLSEAAGAISNGRLGVRVETQPGDELDHLGKIFNDMAGRLEDLVDNLEKKVQHRTIELAASEKRFRYLVQDLPKIAVQGYDADRRVVFWNRASEVLYGYSEVEAMGRRLEELIIPQDMQRIVIRDIRNWQDNNVPIPSSELQLRHKNGHDVQVYSSYVMQDIGNEKIMYCVDIGLDELKLAQHEHQRSEQFYRRLFDHSSSGVAVFEAVEEGRDFIFKDLNRAGEIIENISPGALIGRRVTEAFPGVRELGLLNVLSEVWQSGEPAFHPVGFYQDQRIKGWRENKVYKLPTGEVVAVYDDMTKQKQVEEEKEIVELRLLRAQKMEAIGLLASGVAHDLNNILSAIVGYPDLLLMQLPPDSALRQPIETMKEAGERASAVVADLLTVARGVASNKVAVDVNRLVRKYIDSPELDKLRTSHPHVVIQCDMTDNLPAISCSKVHISKCIMNLVMNGVEAIDRFGVVTLSTSIEIPENRIMKQHGLEQGEHVILRVSDTGKGISGHDLNHIFEPFYTKKKMGKQSGTGLGLSVVWNTMKDHNGAVVVNSGDNGTSFSLYFPISKYKVDKEGKKKSTLNLAANGENILVVDDEPHQRDLVKKNA